MNTTAELVDFLKNLPKDNKETNDQDRPFTESDAQALYWAYKEYVEILYRGEEQNNARAIRAFVKLNDLMEGL